MAFRTQLLVGLGGLLTLMLATGIVSVAAFRSAVQDEDAIAQELSDDLINVERLRFRVEKLVATSRGSLLTGKEHPTAGFEQARGQLLEQLVLMKSRSAGDAGLESIERAVGAYSALVEAALKQPRTAGDPAELMEYFDEVVRPAREGLDSALSAFVKNEREVLEHKIDASRSAARRAGLMVAGSTLVGLVSGLGLAIALLRRLSQQFERERQAVGTARHAVEVRDEVLAVVSHDLRNPLGAVMVACDLLRRESFGLGERALHQVEAARSASQRMKYLIENLLEAVRLETSGITLSIAAHDVGALLADVIKLFESQALLAGVEFKVRAPPSAEEVRGDRERLLQVLANLVGNAIKFTPSGGTVELSCRVENGAATFSVRDTGTGIPPDQQALIFERHWQAKRGGRSGLGLGLYIAKRIVELHGGTLWLESELGRGSAFHFRVPA